MQNSARRKVKRLLAVGVGIFVVLSGAHFWPDESPVESVAVKNVDTISDIYLSTSTLPVMVSGVVSAANSATIYAETAGVITALPAREGAVVSVGQLLARQSTPVADAQVALAAAQEKLTTLQQNEAALTATKQAEQSAQQAYSANRIAQLRTVGNDARMDTVSAQLLVAVEEGALSAITAVKYVNENRPLFTATGLAQYDQVVAQLYGTLPDYFNNGLITSSQKPGVNLEKLLATLRSTEHPTVSQLLAAMTITESQLQALTQLMKTAETDVFDRHSDFVTAAMQEEYLTRRQAVLTTLQSLISTQTAFEQTANSVLQDTVAQDTHVKVTAIDESLAQLHAQYVAQIANQAAVVAHSAVAVAEAGQSLGRVRAPFAGEISKVFVDVGQYVAPGTPLLKLVGTGARELTVTVPAAVLSAVQVGQPFVVEDTVVGQVTRVSRVTEGASGQVVIALTNAPAVTVGSSLSGALITTPNAVYTVPRAAVFFAVTGPYLTYVDNTTTKVQVVYDDGQNLYVTVSRPQPTPLKLATSINL